MPPCFSHAAATVIVSAAPPFRRCADSVVHMQIASVPSVFPASPSYFHPALPALSAHALRLQPLCYLHHIPHHSLIIHSVCGRLRVRAPKRFRFEDSKLACAWGARDVEKTMRLFCVSIPG
ncbi:hypothetical protein BC834DRAFT_1046816 [Gloeopeniophorella convolvens]|nr:hypothetical protein BC834DRAFT_1046816 [Gloeopeniophorella convolvens]